MFIAPQLCTINADPSENLHTSFTDRAWDLIKIWTQTVLITKSYDQNKFQLFLLIKTIEKINQSPENCCKLMRALTLSQEGVFLAPLI